MNKKKMILIISIALVSILLIVGVSYAAISYNRIGSNQQLVLGDIWMKYTETTGLSIQDAMPGADYSKYFEFTITGRNTYTEKDIYYDFILTRGELPEGKTEENRIPDEYLKFKLVSVDLSNQETVIFTDEKYDSLENKRIYVETIEKNTTNEVNRKYRLYMTIDNSLEIGNSNTALFTLDEWVNAFATVKLNVTGDFSEKEVFRYNDCFETYEKIFYKRNPDMTEEELEFCENYFSDEVFPEESSSRAFCEGTGRIIDYEVSYISYGFNDYINSSGVMWPEDFEYLENNNIIIKDKMGLEISYYDSSCGSDVVIPSSINGADVLAINGWSFNEKELTSVIIPDSIISIGEGAFHRNNLTNVEIPDTVTYIGGGAFTSNRFNDSKFIYARTDNNEDGIAEIDSTTLVSYAGNGGYGVTVTIPNGIVAIGNYAFYWLEDIFQMDYITFPNTLKIIGHSAFAEAIDLQIEQNIIFPSLEVLGAGAFDSLSYGGSYGEDYSNLGENSTLTLPNIKIIGSESIPGIKNIIIGDKIEKIDRSAFNEFTFKPGEENSNYFRSIKISKSCNEIEKIPGINKLESSDQGYGQDFYYYPWITYDEPYYVVDSTEPASVFIYGLNDELCGSYTSYYN